MNGLSTSVIEYQKWDRAEVIVRSVMCCFSQLTWLESPKPTERFSSTKKRATGVIAYVHCRLSKRANTASDDLRLHKGWKFFTAYDKVTFSDKSDDEASYKQIEVDPIPANQILPGRKMLRFIFKPFLTRLDSRHDFKLNCTDSCWRRKVSVCGVRKWRRNLHTNTEMTTTKTNFHSCKNIWSSFISTTSVRFVRREQVFMTFSDEFSKRYSC